MLHIKWNTDHTCNRGQPKLHFPSGCLGCVLLGGKFFHDEVQKQDCRQHISMGLYQKGCDARRSPLITEKPIKEVTFVLLYFGHQHAVPDITVKSTRFCANGMLRIAKTGDV